MAVAQVDGGYLGDDDESPQKRIAKGSVPPRPANMAKTPWGRVNPLQVLAQSPGVRQGQGKYLAQHIWWHTTDGGYDRGELPDVFLYRIALGDEIFHRHL